MMNESMQDELQKAGRITAANLRWRCDPEQFEFQTTDDLTNLEGLLGQARAESAIEFGVGMRCDGYNLYVLGPPGSGKRTMICDYLEKRAQDEPRPSDWCYVNNFQDEDRPKAIELPAGQGRELVDDIGQLVDELQSAIPVALESEEHRRKVEQAEQQFQEEHAKSLDDLAKEAHKSGLEMIRTPSGVALAPFRDGQVIGPEDFEKLAEAERKVIEDAIEAMQPKLQAIIQDLPRLRKMARQKVRELNRDAARFVIEHLIAPLKTKYQQLRQVVSHLDDVESDVIENVDQFQSSGDAVPAMLLAAPGRPSFDQYLVNLLVDNTENKGAPVVYEDYPYFHNLIGRVEHETHMGSLITHFSLIKAGGLHRANGGYLVVQARDVLLQPFSWEALKRALRSGKIQIESLGAAMSLISTVSLQPEPIPLDVKVVLLGDRILYYLLQQYDPDFDELFKVAVDFNDETDCSTENCQLYAQMLATLAKQDGTRPLDRTAVALIIEQAARYAGDNEKLSTHMRSIADLIRESDHWAGKENADVVNGDHVRLAIDQQIYRSDRIRQRVHEEIRRGTLLVDTEGQSVGQVNGLSVFSLGKFTFGRPSRITATARLGRGKVVDIEREVELGGAVHSKGVLILSSLLAARYAKDYPLSLSASLVFEQSYGMVDGDSASVAELCALLSTLADIPIKQSLAITGSLNQHGQAQPIGGVNEKIEGFFDVCRSVGLTGDQGVLIPAANVKHLMLRPDVIQAVSDGKFTVYSYEDIDDAITLLTGVEAGVQDTSGNYPPETINFLVDRRLRELAELQRAFAEQPKRGET
jgi:lon-related putative ATP-dependent protease